jgi:hypothetical protein
MYVTSSSFGACPICVRLSLQRHPLFNVLSGAAACRCRRTRTARPHCLPPHVLHAGPGSGICRGSAAAGGCLEYMAGASRAGTSGWAVHPLARTPWHVAARHAGRGPPSSEAGCKLSNLKSCSCSFAVHALIRHLYRCRRYLTKSTLRALALTLPRMAFLHTCLLMSLTRQQRWGCGAWHTLVTISSSHCVLLLLLLLRSMPGTVLLCHPPSKHCHHTPNVLYECSSTGLPACRLACLHLSHVTHALPCMHAPAVCAAGEEGGAENIWSALKDLQVDRIDHGVRCLDDPALVAHLEKCGTALTVCPLSNLCLQVSASLRAPPFDGLCFCVLLFALGPATRSPRSCDGARLAAHQLEVLGAGGGAAGCGGGMM